MSSRTFDHPVDGALYMAKAGFRVFPLPALRKSPPITGWQDWATSDERLIQEYNANHNGCNWGVFTDKMLVVDIDKKEGRDGDAAWLELQTKNGAIPATFTVRSPTGSRHFYLAGVGNNSNDAIAAGIDTRGMGGYVVAPGSRTPAGSYVIEAEVGVIPAPGWLVDALQTKAKEPLNRPEDQDADGSISEGRRNSEMARWAGVLRGQGLTQAEMYAALLEMNRTRCHPPLPDGEIANITRSIGSKPRGTAQAMVDFGMSDFQEAKPSVIRASDIEIEKLPKRQWVMDGRYIGGYLSLLVSPGGTGKSTLSMLDAMAVVTGKNISGAEVIRQGGVWVYNTEDPMDELKRRTAAMAMHHGIRTEQLARLHISRGRDRPFVLVKHDGRGLTVNESAMDAAVKFIKEYGIVLFLLDPFVRLHECPENENVAIDKVAWVLTRIAERTGCAVGVVHHTRKLGGVSGAGDPETARGAGALVNAARVAHTLQGMTEQEARQLGIEPKRAGWYMRLDSAKSNMHRPVERADWFERRSVMLPNGDEVGAIEHCTALAGRMAELEATSEQVSRQELGDRLSGLLEVGKSMPFRTLADMSDLSEIVGNVRKRTRYDKVKGLLANGIISGGKRFTLLQQNEGRQTRVRIVCEAAERDNADLF